MNYARIEKSDRLKRVLEVLKDGKRHTTLEIIQRAIVCAVNSIVCELRCNGYVIDCKRKGDVWEYQLRDN